MRTLTLFLTIALLCTACGRFSSGDGGEAIQTDAPAVATTTGPDVELTGAEPTDTIPEPDETPAEEPEEVWEALPEDDEPESEGFLLPDLGDAAPATDAEAPESTTSTTSTPPEATEPEIDCRSYHRMFAGTNFYNVTTTEGYVDLVRGAASDLSLASKASIEGWLGLVQYGAYSNDEVKERTKRLDDNTVADCGVPFVAMSIATSAGFEAVCAQPQNIDPDGGATTTTEAPSSGPVCAYPERTPPTVFPCFKREKTKNTPSSFFQRGYTNFEVIDCETTEPVVLLIDGTWGPNPLG